MVEVALVTFKDMSLLISGVLLLVLAYLLIFRPHQQSLRPLYWICLAVFFAVGVMRMFDALARWDIALDAAVLLVVSNILFTAGCVVFLQGPMFIAKLAVAHGAAQKQVFSAKNIVKKIIQKGARARLFNSSSPSQPGFTTDDTFVEVQPQLAEKLTDFMEQKKPYLEPHITVERLAIKLNVSPKLLSGTINNELQMNFFELIGNYRVLEAKKRLADVTLREKPICEIMKSCGFNSKSVFNQAFKKAVGVTPSHYRQQHIQL